MFEWVLISSLALLAVAMLATLYRLLKGPTVPDRILALDAIGYHLIGMTTILSILLYTTAFLEVILLIGILAFLGTIALTKFVERGEVIEHKRND